MALLLGGAFYLVAFCTGVTLTIMFFSIGGPFLWLSLFTWWSFSLVVFQFVFLSYLLILGVASFVGDAF